MLNKLFSGAVAVAFAFSLAFVGTASAQTVSELTAQLAALQAQLAALQGGGTTTTTTTSAGCYPFTLDLTIGSTGTEVVQLQTALEGLGFFTYAGTKGYFGPITQASVSAWQAANGVAPTAGYWGPISRATYAASCVVVVPGDNGDDGDDFNPTTNDDDFDGDDEGDVENFDVEDADDSDLEEGNEEVEIGLIEFDVEDSKLMLDRLDLVFDPVTPGVEDDPWQSFDMLYLEYDGDIVAEVDASDKDEYEEESDFDGDADDEYRIRFKNVDLILDEGEHELMVLADIANGLDGVDGGTEQEWEWFVPTTGTDGALFISPNGVVAYEGSSSDRADFTLGEAGGDAELDVSLSNSSPDSTTIEVNDNSDTEETVMTFELRAEEDSVTVNELTVSVDIVHPTSAATSTLLAEDVIDDVMLVGAGIDVDTDTNISSAATSSVDADGDGTADDLRVTFEFDLEDAGDEIELDEDEEMDIDVVISFNGYDGNYPEGTEVRAVITSANADATDAESHGEDLGATQISGSATGDLHVLFEEGIDVEVTDITVTTTEGSEAPNDGKTIEVEYVIEMDVTAFGDTFYVPFGTALSSSTVGGVSFDIENSSNVSTASSTPGSASAFSDLASSATQEGSAFRIESGDTESFTLTVSVTSVEATVGFNRVQVESLRFFEDSGLTTGETSLNLLPEEDFQTDTKELEA